jgi:broad specificity phosphatase PhoE
MSDPARADPEPTEAPDPDRRIVLLRHPETEDNREPVRVQGRRDVPLSAAGLEHAHELAASLAAADPAFATLYCTPLERSRRAAEIIGAALDREPVLDERLSESWRGAWEGLTWEEIADADPAGHAAFLRAGADFRFPGGESLAEHSGRVRAALADVSANGHLPALIVCHGGTIRVALCHALGRGLDAFHDWDVPNGALVTLPPASW